MVGPGHWAAQMEKEEIDFICSTEVDVLNLLNKHMGCCEREKNKTDFYVSGLSNKKKVM